MYFLLPRQRRTNFYFRWLVKLVKFYHIQENIEPKKLVCKRTRSSIELWTNLFVFHACKHTEDNKNSGLYSIYIRYFGPNSNCDIEDVFLFLINNDIEEVIILVQRNHIRKAKIWCADSLNLSCIWKKKDSVITQYFGILLVNPATSIYILIHIITFLL